MELYETSEEECYNKTNSNLHTMLNFMVLYCEFL